MSYNENEWDFSAGRQAYEPGEQALNHPAEEFDLSVGPSADEFDLGLDDDDEEDVAEGVVTVPLWERIKPLHIAILGVVAALAVIAYFGTTAVDTRVSGAELMKKYSEAELIERKPGESLNQIFFNRHIVFLEAVEKGNLHSRSKELVTVEVTGEKGTIVEFKIMPTSILPGNDESFYMAPFDGPFALAACRLMELDLPTPWMGKELRRQVFKNGDKVWFIAEPEIRTSLGENSTANERDYSLRGLGRRKGPKEMDTPRIIKARGDLFMELMARDPLKSGQAISGHFKEVVQDPAQAARDKLATLPACGGVGLDDGWEKKPNFGCILVAQKHPPRYFDYSHGVRCAEPELRVKGESMTIVEFYSNKKYRTEFMLGPALKVPPYKYPPLLQKWLREHGHEDVLEFEKPSKK